MTFYDLIKPIDWHAIAMDWSDIDLFREAFAEGQMFYAGN